MTRTTTADGLTPGAARTVRPRPRETAMSKRTNKRKNRKKSGANHGKRPNA